MPMVTEVRNRTVIWLAVGASAVLVLGYALSSLIGTPAGILFLLAPAVVGAVLGRVMPVRERWLLVPVLALAIAYWIYGWFGDAYDIGRFGLVLITGIYGAFVFMSWFAGVRLGRRPGRPHGSA